MQQDGVSDVDPYICGQLILDIGTKVIYGERIVSTNGNKTTEYPYGKKITTLKLTWHGLDT